MSIDLSKEELKSKIKGLEEKIQLEKNIYSKEKQKKELKILKNLVLKYITPLEVKEKEITKLRLENQLIHTDKISLKDIKNDTISINGKEVYLENITNCHLDIISLSSLVMVNVYDSEIKCSAKQIRLINCGQLIIHAYTEIGIYIEKCSFIKIKKSKEEKNLCENVKDFSNPFGKKNYEIID